MGRIFSDERIRERVEEFKASPKEMSPEMKNGLETAIYEFLKSEGPMSARAIRNNVLSGVDDDDLKEILNEMENEGIIEARYQKGEFKVYYIKN